MLILLSIIVLGVVTQNSVQAAITGKCHRHRNGDVVCLHKGGVTPENGEKARFDNVKAFQYSQDMPRDFTSAEDDIPASYEEMRDLPENIHQRDVSLSMDKSENVEDVKYTRPHKLHNLPESGDIADRELEMQPLKLVRGQHINNVKYESYDQIKNDLKINHWTVKKDRPSDIQKRFFPVLIFSFLAGEVIEFGVKKIIKAVGKK